VNLKEVKALEMKGKGTKLKGGGRFNIYAFLEAKAPPVYFG